jgi:translation initiation factor IF-2
MSDPARFPEARLNFWDMLKEQHLKGIPIEVFANKVDLIECTKKDLANALGLTTKLNKILRIFKTSAKTGEGIYEGIYWLVDAIHGNSQYFHTFPHLKSLFRRPKTIITD